MALGTWKGYDGEGHICIKKTKAMGVRAILHLLLKNVQSKKKSNSLLVLRNLLSLQPGYFFWKVFFKKNRHNSSVCRYLSNLCEIKKENDAQNSSRQIRRPNPNKSRYIFMQIQPSYNKKSYKIWQIKLTLHASFVEIFELDMNTWELDTSVEKGVLNTSSEFCWHFPHFPHCPHCPHCPLGQISVKSAMERRRVIYICCIYKKFQISLFITQHLAQNLFAQRAELLRPNVLQNIKCSCFVFSILNA